MGIWGKSPLMMIMNILGMYWWLNGISWDLASDLAVENGPFVDEKNDDLPIKHGGFL